MRISTLKSKFVHVASALLAPGLIACGSAGPEGKNEGDIGEVSESLAGNCTATLTASPTPRQTSLGGGVTLTGSATCVGGATPEFRFTANTPATNTKLVACNWQAGTVCNWPTAALTQEGVYTLAVEVRRQGQTAFDVKKTLRYGIGRACTGVNVSVAPSPPDIDELVTFTATPTCDPGVSAEYRFDIKPPGATVFSLGSWQPSAVATWDSTGASAGAASVRVTLRQQGYKLNDAAKTLPFTLGGENCKATALAVGTVGPNLALSGKSSCTGGGVAEYRFSQIGPNGGSTLLEDWSPDRFSTWPTAGLSGTYYARVEVRAQGTPQVPTLRQMKRTFGDACTSVTLAPVSGPVVLGNAAGLNASAPCANPEFLYQVKPSTGAAWTTVCPYSTSATCNWVVPLVTAPGTYNARVQVRAVGTTLVTYEALSAVQNFDVVQVAADGDGDGYSTAAGDCDDGNAAVFPGATEACNGEDDDCDGQVDEGLDADGDGVTTCAGDCNDGDASVHPAATEACNAVDDDCDGQVDEGFDGDGDGVTSCEGDCDDADATVFPGATETCNGEDDDCNAEIDEGFDVDDDGVSTCGGDCNDGNAAVHLGATEACNGIDDDCDGAVDEGCATTVMVSGGAEHTCALRTDGRLYCWGGNLSGQGDAQPSGPKNSPKLVTFNLTGSGGTGALHVFDIATGGSHTCILRRNPATADGSYTVSGVDVFNWACWGANGSGQTGNTSSGSGLHEGGAGPAASFGRPEQIVAGRAHTCIRTSLGTAYCWGANASGQLGNGNNTGGPTRVQVVTSSGPLTGVVDIAATHDHTCAATSTGQAYCWGLNNNLQLGVLDQTNRNVATPVLGGVLGTQIATTTDATCLRTFAGNVSCWGFGTATGSSSSFVPNPTTVTAVNTNGALEVRGGANFMCARKGTGEVCWGNNARSQLNASAPLSAPGALIRRAGEHNCAIEGGSLYCWGLNTQGQCGVGTFGPALPLGISVPTLVTSWPSN